MSTELFDTIAHDLTADELAFLTKRTSGKRKGVSRWRWVWVGDVRMTNPHLRIEAGAIVEAGADGDYTTVQVVRAIHDAHVRLHQRASAAAKKAAITRAQRMKRRVYEAARRLRENLLQPSSSCCICGRGLDDRESVQRGIGSECWQQVLGALSAQNKQGDAA